MQCVHSWVPFISKRNEEQIHAMACVNLGNIQSERVILKRLDIEWIHLSYMYDIHDSGQKLDEWLPGSRRWGATAKRWWRDANVLKLNSHSGRTAKTSESYTWGVWILWYVIISNLWAIKNESILLSTCIYSDTWDLSREPTVSGISSLSSKLHTHSVSGQSSECIPKGKVRASLLQAFKASTWDSGLFLPHHSALLIRCSPAGGMVDLEPTLTDKLIWQKTRPMMWLLWATATTWQSWPQGKCSWRELLRSIKHAPYQIYLVRGKSGRVQFVRAQKHPPHTHTSGC